MAVAPQVLSIQDFLLSRDVRLTAEVERHSDRTMTVVSLSGTETITRCRICPKEDGRPCSALRRLALPYAEHPAYRPEWRVIAADAENSTVGEGASSGH